MEAGTQNEKEKQVETPKTGMQNFIIWLIFLIVPILILLERR